MPVLNNDLSNSILNDEMMDLMLKNGLGTCYLSIEEQWVDKENCNKNVDSTIKIHA